MLVLALFGFALQSCDTPAQKVENAEEDVIRANENLNKKSMAEFQERIAADKSEAKADYLAKIEALDRKNSDMEKKMDDFKTDSESEWGDFKREFSRDMDVLRDSLESLFGKDAR